jgi:hypothetical protein
MADLPSFIDKMPKDAITGSALESRYLNIGFAGLAAISLGSFI